MEGKYIWRDVEVEAGLTRTRKAEVTISGEVRLESWLTDGRKQHGAIMRFTPLELLEILGEVFKEERRRSEEALEAAR